MGCGEERARAKRGEGSVGRERVPDLNAGCSLRRRIPPLSLCFRVDDPAAPGRQLVLPRADPGISPHSPRLQPRRPHSPSSERCGPMRVRVCTSPCLSPSTRTEPPRGGSALSRCVPSWGVFPTSIHAGPKDAVTACCNAEPTLGSAGPEPGPRRQEAGQRHRGECPTAPPHERPRTSVEELLHRKKSARCRQRAAMPIKRTHRDRPGHRDGIDIHITADALLTQRKLADYLVGERLTIKSNQSTPQRDIAKRLTSSCSMFLSLGTDGVSPR